MTGVHGFHNPTDYDSQRKPGEGYYGLDTNNLAEKGSEKVWPESVQNKENEFAEEGVNTEKVNYLEPRLYENRANNNFFGGRTAWYA